MTDQAPATAGWLVSILWEQNGPWLQYWVATYEREEDAKAAVKKRADLVNRNVRVEGTRRLSDAVLKRLGLPANEVQQHHVHAFDELMDVLG